MIVRFKQQGAADVFNGEQSRPARKACPKTHPGEMLREEFLRPLGMSQRELAESIRVSYQRVNELTRGRRGLTPTLALRLAKYFGVSPDFWLNLQLRWDLYHAQRREAGALKKIDTRVRTELAISKRG